jgi:hypothetical protein
MALLCKVEAVIGRDTTYYRLAIICGQFSVPKVYRGKKLHRDRSRKQHSTGGCVSETESVDTWSLIIHVVA